jgi:hypothetical protein
LISVTAYVFSLAFVGAAAGTFGYLLRRFEAEPAFTVRSLFTWVRSLRDRLSRRQEEALLEADDFCQSLADVTGDDIRLRRYKPKRDRNQTPLAIAATPATTSANMQRIASWVKEHGVDEAPASLAKTVSSTRRRF